MKLSLPDVTLVMYESKDPERGLKVFSHVANLIEFGNHLFVTNRKDGLAGSARFVVCDLSWHLQTSHCLIIHIDGFPIHPENWRPEFLHYDYIGALWPDGPRRMGNGVGIRSKKLCDQLACFEFNPTRDPEDVFICIQKRDELEQMGFQFAPDELAAQFSLEQEIPGVTKSYDDVFMFHGSPNKGGYPTQRFIEEALK